MIRFKEQVFSNHDIEQIFQLVIDIESYPEFVPWCSGAKILEQRDDEIIADLEISFKALHKSYTSGVSLIHPYNGKAEVNVGMISGPFKHLYNSWHLEAADDGTIIDFSLDFALNSIFLEKAVGIMFKSACKKMMDAFKGRADTLINL